MSKNGQSYTRPASKYEQPWITAVREATRVAMRHNATLEPPYNVALEFRLQAPKKQATRAGSHPTACDLDKLIRCVIDGLVLGGAITDDRHVTELTASKRYAQPGEEPGVAAYVSEVVPIRAVA